MSVAAFEKQKVLERLQALFGPQKDVRPSPLLIYKLSVPVMVVSAFLNNTPVIVDRDFDYVVAWCIQLPIIRLLPCSYRLSSITVELPRYPPPSYLSL
jgi:hypothetical protein